MLLPQLVRTTAVTSLAVSLPIYAFLALLFYEFNLSYLEWACLFLQLTGACWLIVATCFVLFHLSVRLRQKLLQLIRKRTTGLMQAGC